MTDLADIAAYWDAAANDFDDEPDHGLRVTETRAAWAHLLRAWLPTGPTDSVGSAGPTDSADQQDALDVLDVGCGTGSLTALLARAGHRVTGVDLAPGMVAVARAKLASAGLDARFLVGDATAPPTGDRRFDALVARHLVWTLPDPWAALHEWIARLRPGGTLVLIEGRWHPAGGGDAQYVAGAEALPWFRGISAGDLAEAVRPHVTDLRIEPLSAHCVLWGRPVTDERYALIATRP